MVKHSPTAVAWQAMSWQMPFCKVANPLSGTLEHTLKSTQNLNTFFAKQYINLKLRGTINA